MELGWKAKNLGEKYMSQFGTYFMEREIEYLGACSDSSVWKMM